ncbi:hypothetical protein [Bifidobacterium aquikefiri]|uniref:hypothetical protein n=1 Tax=Bifidobacterium aquikefiri TaxID=1653207 RepID=UPI0039EC82E7
MHGTDSWNYHSYGPNPTIDPDDFRITRIVPHHDGFSISWSPALGERKYIVRWNDIEHGDEGSLLIDSTAAIITGLREGFNYRVVVSTIDGSLQTRPRVLRTSDVPGTVFNFLHTKVVSFKFYGRVLARPSIVRLSNGRLLASMDVFSWHGGQNLTMIFSSDDAGETWEYLTELFPCFWGAMFVHRDALYMLAMTTEYGDLIIGRASDEGRSWSQPVTLFRSSANGDVGGLHKAPLPIVETHGCLVTAIDYGSWETGGFQQAIVSVPSDADLLDPDQWNLSKSCNPKDALLRNASIVGSGLEGNVVVGNDGIIHDMLRLQLGSESQHPSRALMLTVDPSLTSLSFEGTVPFNGGNNSKFFVLFDAQSALYWAVGNEIAGGDADARNILSLSCSKDLAMFENVHRIVDLSHGDPRYVAAQYPSCIIDGNDLLVVSRTAWNEADSYHNSNYITFHRVQDFRQYAR